MTAPDPDRTPLFTRDRGVTFVQLVAVAVALVGLALVASVPVAMLVGGIGTAVLLEVRE